MSLKPPPTVNDDILDLTVRFSASLPDLLLSISFITHPNANTSTLKQLIRQRLPPEYSSRRIRLIYAGKALVDDASLASSLKRSFSRSPSRPPTPAIYSAQDEDSPSAKLKGKAPVRDPPLHPRIYIHCSIGDVVLSPLRTRRGSISGQSDPAHTASRCILYSRRARRPSVCARTPRLRPPAQCRIHGSGDLVPASAVPLHPVPYAHPQ